MCTVTWEYTESGGNAYRLFCNRDEKHTRAIAAPPGPYVSELTGVQFLAPRDPDGGGTWLSVNESGITVCLLNAATSNNSAVPKKSRGALVWALAGAGSLSEIRNAILKTDLEPYAAFTLLALAPTLAPLVYTWDAAGQLECADPHIPMLTSSSFDSGRVCASRLLDFQATTRNLDDFHRSHGDHPNGSAYSTCMHREDAATVSFSRIDVSATTACFHYSPGAPCRNLPGHTISLHRRS